jgi:hypothetical protein
LAVFPEDLHKLAADASVVAVLDVVVWVWLDLVEWFHPRWLSSPTKPRDG